MIMSPCKVRIPKNKLDTTTTKFASHACAVQCISLPVVVDKVGVVVLKFPIIALTEASNVPWKAALVTDDL